jgi:RecB family exonuclease
MLRGRVIHAVAQGAYQRTLDNQPLPSAEEAQDQAASGFEQEWSKGVELDAEDQAIGPVKAKGNSKDFAVDLSGYHVVTVAPAVHPIAVEEHITVKPADSDITIHGIVDLIDLTPDGDVIRDLKTAEKSPPQDAAEKSQQLSFYSMIWYADTGVLPKRLTLDTLVRTPARAEKKHIQLHTVRDAADDAALVHRLNTAVETVKRGVFMPASADSWACSEKFCEFWTSCVYTRRSARPTT